MWPGRCRSRLCAETTAELAPAGPMKKSTNGDFSRRMLDNRGEKSSSVDFSGARGEAYAVCEMATES